MTSHPDATKLTFTLGCVTGVLVEAHKANGALHYARAKELQTTVPPSAAPTQEDDVSAVMSTEEQSAQVRGDSAGVCAQGFR